MSRIFLVLSAFVCLVFAGPVRPVGAAPSTQSDVPGHWECWQDGSPDPCHVTINALAFASLNSGWAVGSGGVILRWQGNA